MMVDILDLCLKRSFSKGDLSKLQEIITLHNKEFLKLFQRNLPPKAHYLLHYRRAIENVGPLKHVWSMRFEAKHQELKAYAKVCFNRINLRFSLGKKICFYNAADNSKYETLKRVKTFKGINTTLDKDFKDILSEYTSCHKVDYNGRMYTIGDIIITSCLRFACRVKQIAMDYCNDNVYLITENIEIEYEEIYRSYSLGATVPSSKHCFPIEYFKHPPTKKHWFQNKFYIKCEDF